MATIRLDPMLRDFIPRKTVETECSTVLAMIEELESQYPRLRLRIRDEVGDVRRFVKVFVNGDSIDELQGLQTPLASRDQVDILHSIQGG
jgi:sulfur-carrier protein